MISVVTWVNNRDQYRDLLSTCKDTWEIIEIGQECKSMAEAYRKGVNNSVGEYLLFIHQDARLRDVLFEERFIKALNQPNVGIVGVIGGLQTAYGSWWTQGTSLCRGRVIQGSGDNLLDFGVYEGECAQVDGLLMGMRREVALKHLDELFSDTYSKVHFQDMFMCTKLIELGYKNYIFPTFVQHLSGGENQSEEYRTNLAKYQNYLSTLNSK